MASFLQWCDRRGVVPDPVRAGAYGSGSQDRFNTKGVYDSRFTAEVNKNKMLVISERIGARERSETEVTVYYNNLEEIRISGRMPRSGNRSTFRRPGAGFPTGRSSARRLM